MFWFVTFFESKKITIKFDYPLITSIVSLFIVYFLGIATIFYFYLLCLITAMSQIRLYEYMFQMWRIDLYALCIRTFDHIWNMYSYNRIWDIAVTFWLKTFFEWCEYKRIQTQKIEVTCNKFRIFLKTTEFTIFYKGIYCKFSRWSRWSEK